MGVTAFFVWGEDHAPLGEVGATLGGVENEEDGLAPARAPVAAGFAEAGACSWSERSTAGATAGTWPRVDDVRRAEPEPVDFFAAVLVLFIVKDVGRSLVQARGLGYRDEIEWL